jgi:glycosyltransferase involved in cell wall biosynthesis
VKNLPLVSVLIPSYNSNHSLRIAINSIKSQSYKNLEVVIVDDGSKPKVPDYNKDPEFSKLKLKLIRLKRNLGIVKCLNKGLNHCNGAIIARLDADDIMLKNRLLNQVSAILKYNLDLVYSQMLVDGKKNIYFYPITKKAIRLCASYGNPIPHPAVAIKAKILKKYKYKDLNIRGLEDYFLWVKIIKSGYKVQGLPFYDVDYKTSPKQLSKRKGTFNSRYKKAMTYLENYLDSDTLNSKNKHSIFVILKILRMLKGIDLKAFKQILISNMKRTIYQEKKFFKKSQLFLILIIIKFFKII